jgi:hypothetical protein
MSSLQADFDTALASNVIGSAPLVIYQWSIKAIIDVVMAKALELGREYRDEIEDAAKAAVDRVVAMDLPGVPAGVETVIDDLTRDAAYRAISAVLDALLTE